MKNVTIFFLWFVFAVIEVSDLVDGHIARSMNEVSDLGKLLDPFSDVISRMTYFFCFTVIEIMPVWVFVIIMYREYSILFLRMMAIRKGTVIAARMGGKLKSVGYAISGIFGLILITARQFHIFSAVLPYVEIVTLVAFIFAAVASALSFIDYLLVMKKLK